MNRIEGKIIRVDTFERYCVTSIACTGEVTFLSLTLELDERYHEGRSVALLVKETDVIIAKESFASSVANIIPSTVLKNTRGELFSELELSTSAGTISAIIFTSAIETLKIDTGDSVFALIRATDVALMIDEI